jgi:hypothetical protein
MKITKDELYNPLIEARAVLYTAIRERFKNRNMGFLPDLARKHVRQKIAAYRVLSNIFTVEAEIYTHNAQDVRRVKKALAK